MPHQGARLCPAAWGAVACEGAGHTGRELLAKWTAMWARGNSLPQRVKEKQGGLEGRADMEAEAQGG